MHVELWFDFSCPYAYLASRRIEALVAGAGATLSWHPMLLGGVFRGTGAGDGPMATLGAAKAAHNQRDMQRWAERFDAPFAVPTAHPMRTVRALRVLLGVPEAAWPGAVHAIYAAYWEHGEDVTSDAVIDAALAAGGVDDRARAAAFARADSPEIKDALRARTDQAIALGIFGAPAFVVRRPDKPNVLLWGQDRLDMLDGVLRGWDPDADGPPPGGPRLPGVQVARPAAARDPSGREADAARAGTPAGFGGRAGSGQLPVEIDFWFDVASPFAYLGSTQIDALAARLGARVTWRPLLLGGLFKEIGQHEVPLFAMPQAKRAYIGMELLRWSRWWGVPFRFPKTFPMRTVTAQRMLVAAPADARPALAHRMFRAAWVDGADLGDDAVLAAIDPALHARAKDPDVKQALIAETAAARDAGVFGVPTCVVHDPAGPLAFWGQDRLDLVAEAIAGWRPRAG